VVADDRGAAATPLPHGNTFLGSTQRAVWFVQTVATAGQQGRQSAAESGYASASAGASGEASAVGAPTRDRGGSRPVVCDHMQSRRTGPSACSTLEHSHRKLSQRALVASSTAAAAAAGHSPTVRESIAAASSLSQGDHGGVSRPHSEYESSASANKQSSSFTSTATRFSAASKNGVGNMSTAAVGSNYTSNVSSA